MRSPKADINHVKTAFGFAVDCSPDTADVAALCYLVIGVLGLIFC